MSKHREYVQSPRKRRRPDQYITACSSALSSTIDFSFLQEGVVTSLEIPEPRSPPNHSLIETSKRTVCELRDVPLTFLKQNEQDSFFEALCVLRRAFPHDVEFNRIGKNSISLFKEYSLACSKAIMKLTEKLVPIYNKKKEYETSLQKLTAMELEANKMSVEYYDKNIRAKELEKITMSIWSQIEELRVNLAYKEAEGLPSIRCDIDLLLVKLKRNEVEDVLSIRSQIKQLEAEMKSKRAELVALRNEVDALLLNGVELVNRLQVQKEELVHLRHFIGPMLPNARQWSKELNLARERLVFLNEQWNFLSQLDPDSLAQSSSTNF